MLLFSSDSAVWLHDKISVMIGRFAFTKQGIGNTKQNIGDNKAYGTTRSYKVFCKKVQGFFINLFL